MYVGRVGVLVPAHRPAQILVIQGGKLSSDVKNLQLIAGISFKIGNYELRDGTALFDTGSTETVIYLPDAKLRIGADPFDEGMTKGMNGDLETVYYYESHLKFHSGLELDTDLIDVYDHKVEYANVIIGMDIISKGKLTVNGKEGTFTFEI